MVGLRRMFSCYIIPRSASRWAYHAAPVNLLEASERESGQHCSSLPRKSPMVKVVIWSREAHLTKPGWSKPIPIQHLTNLALFGHKITLCCRRAQIGAGGGLSPPWPPHFNHWKSHYSRGYAGGLYKRSTRDIQKAVFDLREWVNRS